MQRQQPNHPTILFSSHEREKEGQGGWNGEVAKAQTKRMKASREGGGKGEGDKKQEKEKRTRDDGKGGREGEEERKFGAGRGKRKDGLDVGASVLFWDWIW